jgi:response regulator RpfG family c-di-GMP phosphodiesterase
MLKLERAPATKRPRVLCVDDEAYVLEGLCDTLRRGFDVRIATGGEEALGILRSDPDGFAVVISDMYMPEMGGSEFLCEARRIAPDAVRMLLTGYADVDSAIRAVNEARLFRYLTKPCESDELVSACGAAAAHHELKVAERELLEQTVHGSVDALVEVLALANPAAFGRGMRLKTLAGRLACAVDLDNCWEVEVAALLAHIGAVTLPQTTVERLYAGVALRDHELAMAERVPAVTRRLLSKIPRLEGVVEILDSYHDSYHEPADAEDARAMPIGARVLRIAIDYDELESAGSGENVAIGVMRGRGVYDPRLLSAFARTVGARRIAPVVREVDVAGLQVGMTLADDVRNVGGGLLVARGQPVTHQLIDRLTNFSARVVREPLRVFDPETGR